MDTRAEVIGMLVAVLAPLVGAQLALVTFYLRSLREQQTSAHEDLRRRVEALDASTMELRRTMRSFERDYTTKEDWLRESLATRGQIDRLTQSAVRLKTLVQALPRVVPRAGAGSTDSRG